MLRTFETFDKIPSVESFTPDKSREFLARAYSLDTVITPFHGLHSSEEYGLLITNGSKPSFPKTDNPHFSHLKHVTVSSIGELKKPDQPSKSFAEIGLRPMFKDFPVEAESTFYISREGIVYPSRVARYFGYIAHLIAMPGSDLESRLANRQLQLTNN